jgi:hypothetical protein
MIDDRRLLIFSFHPIFSEFTLFSVACSEFKKRRRPPRGRTGCEEGFRGRRSGLDLRAVS